MQASHTARDVGDEALLLCQQAPVCISADREAGARFVFSENLGNVILMDDGFQNPSLVKDLSFVLIDGETGFWQWGGLSWQGHCANSAATALQRADAVVFVMPEQDIVFAPRFSRDCCRPCGWQTGLSRVAGTGHISIVYTSITKRRSTAKSCGVSAALAALKSFSAAARSHYTLAETISYRDHHVYTQKDMTRLLALKDRHQATLLTTEKDYVRLSEKMKKHVSFLPVTMQVDDLTGLMALISSKIVPSDD